MSLATLFGKLQEHEMELLRLHQHEENDKKKKGIALKASSRGCASQRRKDARSGHQRLFVENVGKTEGNRSK